MDLYLLILQQQASSSPRQKSVRTFIGSLKNYLTRISMILPVSLALEKAVCFVRLNKTPRTVASKVNLELLMVCFGHFTFFTSPLAWQTMSVVQAMVCGQEEGVHIFNSTVQIRSYLLHRTNNNLLHKFITFKIDQ